MNVCSAECRVSSGSEIRTQDLRFQGEDDTTTQKGLTRKCGRITSVTTFLPLLKRGDLCGVIPSTTVLWPVHNPVPFKQACIYTTEDTIVCDEICIHTNCSLDSFLTSSLPIEVLSAESVPALRFEPGTSDSKAKTIPLHKRV